MNHRVLSVAALAMCLSSAVVHAAPPGAPTEAYPGAPVGPAGPAAGPAQPPLPPGAMPPPAQNVAQGAVQRLLINPYGEIDGLRLADGTIVRFPPHLSDAVAAAVKPGDAVRVVGRPQGRGMVKADAIVNVASGQTVYDQPPMADGGRPLPPHLRAARLQPQKVEGQVDAVLTGRRGEVTGVILSDGSIVPFFTRPIALAFALVTIFTIQLYVPPLKRAVRRVTGAAGAGMRSIFAHRA